MTGSDVSAAVGSPANLICSVSGNPTGTTITYQWKRAGKSIATSAIYQISSSVGVSDAGVYTCEVTVSDTTSSQHVISGNSSVDITLTVISKEDVNCRALLPVPHKHKYVKHHYTYRNFH